MIEMLADVMVERGVPEHLRSDNVLTREEVAEKNCFVPPTSLSRVSTLSERMYSRMPWLTDALLHLRPSLPRLRRSYLCFVRLVHRYYGTVQLLQHVHVRRSA